MILVLKFLIVTASIVGFVALANTVANAGRRESRRYPVDEDIDLGYSNQEDDFEDKL